jgi:glycosyltransferase involved in cell wall biosynthesis
MTEPAPYIEAVVPAYNKQKNIEDCLDSILSQEPHRPFGAPVVDDGSTGRTPRILERYETEYENPREVTKAENRGYGDTIQREFKEASADIVCFIDVDSLIQGGSLAAIVKDYENGVDAVFGCVEVPNDRRLQGLYCKVCKRHNPDARYDRAQTSFRRKVLADLGGFLDVQNRGGHGIGIQARFQKSDYEVVFEDDAKVCSRFPERWETALHQKFRASKTHLIHWSQHPGSFDSGALVNSAYYVVLLGAILTSLGFPSAIGGVIGLGVLFVREHGPRVVEMYRMSGSIKLGASYFPYALAAGYLRTIGYLSEWRTLLTLLWRYRTAETRRGDSPH